MPAGVQRMVKRLRTPVPVSYTHLEKILVLATTGNDLVEKGLIMVIPGVEKKISLPRIKTGKMLQKRKAVSYTHLDVYKRQHLWTASI